MLNFDTLEKDILSLMFNYKKAYGNIKFRLNFDTLSNTDQQKVKSVISKMLNKQYIQKENDGYIITNFGIGVFLYGHNTAKRLVNKYGISNS